MAIPGEKAIQMVRSAHAQAVQLDIQVTAVVVDQSGRMIALGRMDRARPITVDIALNKAYTAASFQQPTKDLAGVAGQTWFQSLVVSSSGRIMPGGGALPIVEGGNIVGAIAVAGGTEEQDQRCAETALASYGGGGWIQVYSRESLKDDLETVRWKPLKYGEKQRQKRRCPWL